jgi:hypothetical protein
MSGQTTRKGALLDSGTPSPNPWDLSLSRQNGCSTMEALERRIGLRRDATRAPIQGPEWQGAGFPSRPQNSTPRPRRALAYCGQKMVLTMGSTLPLYQILQILSVTLFEKTPILQALQACDSGNDLSDPGNQLILFDF